jgi:hypothetical protein
LTDPKNLEYFIGAKKLNWQQARWSCELNDFDFVLKHCPGCPSNKPDLLLRHSDHKTGVNDNEYHVLLKPDFSVSMPCMRVMYSSIWRKNHFLQPYMIARTMMNQLSLTLLK